MVNRYKRFMVAVLLCVISMGFSVQACMVTLLNDSSGKIAIFNELDKTFTYIPKNGKRRFGHHHKQAHFTIYTQQPKTRTEVWTPAYTVKQNTCSSNGNVLLKFSEVQDGTDINNLFTIIKHKPHSSMVRELPMIQKNNCHSCDAE